MKRLYVHLGVAKLQKSIALYGADRAVHLNSPMPKIDAMAGRSAS